MSDIKMQTGALVMMDALGFKGIWKRVDKPECVIDALKLLKATVLEEAASIGARPSKRGYQPFKVEFLSDTVVIGIPIAGTGAPWNPWAINYAAIVASAVIRAAVTKVGVPFVYRGCLSYGDFAIEENFIVGPAVDDAAETMESAQAAIVWVTPSALSRIEIENYSAEMFAKHTGEQLCPWRVPLKGGDYINTLAVSPFIKDEDWDTRRNVREGIQRRLDYNSDLGIMVKAQNTRAFLDEADRLFPSAPPVPPTP